ncbi:hypothetical protein GALMADRAFT_144011 [Galerina marginata CBS 339.88]|uniref:Uncharacterized protein n=1 Tax=Galerina marginata (strain CBS 339.88) TaxID=685588 RepID=A0A067SMQ9_GALM3|nr:hypothetical protein GALMADRAFT_144011 [Galerina marginata CBS 339.88]
MSTNLQVFRNPALGAITDNDDILTAHSSDQIKSTLGRYSLRDANIQRIANTDLHRAAQEYKTQRLLSLAHARSLTSIAHQCETFHKDREIQLLLHLMESGGEHTPQTAHYLATLVRHTLKAEEDHLISMLKERELMSIMLQDAIEEAQVHRASAETQVDKLEIYLSSQTSQLPNSRPMLEVLQPTLPASVLESYQQHLKNNLPYHWLAGSDSLAQSPTICKYPSNGVLEDIEDGDALSPSQ